MKFTPKKLPYTVFKEIYSKVPRLCVDLIIKNEKGILLTKRDIEPFKGYWHFPGGTILFGENIEDTINRVAEEETGLTTKIEKLLGVIEFAKYKQSGLPMHAISLAYLLIPTGGTLKGSYQSKDQKYFKEIPAKTIRKQADFWRQHKLEGLFN